MRAVRKLTLLLAALVVASACTADAPRQVPDAPAPQGVQPLPSPTSTVFASEEPVKPDGRHRFFAVSAEVEQGVPYEFEINTHCGADWRVDFHGSFWRAVAGPKRFQEPRIQGTMTLENEEQALFETTDGTTITFIRHAGKKFEHFCE